MTPTQRRRRQLAVRRRYDQSDKGRARSARYEGSEKGRERVMRYRSTLRGQMAMSWAQHRRNVKRRALADARDQKLLDALHRDNPWLKKLPRLKKLAIVARARAGV